MGDEELEAILKSVQNMASFANAVASLCVGHRSILVEGGFNVDLSDQMAAALHASLLGLVYDSEPEPSEVVFYAHEGFDDEDDDDE